MPLAVAGVDASGGISLSVGMYICRCYNPNIKMLCLRARMVKTVLLSIELAKEMVAMRLRLDATGDDKLDDDAHAAMLKEYDALEVRRVNALENEQRDANAAFAVDHLADTPEIREQRRIMERADVSVMTAAAIRGHNLPDGSAEAEVRAAVGIESDMIPTAMLAEIRVVDAPDASGAGTSPIMVYQFGQSMATFANIQRPMVAAGQHVYPSFTSGAAATRPAASAENADQDPVLRGQLLTPKRVQQNTSLTVEDMATFPGLGRAVAAHLAAAVVAGLDAQAIVDDDGFFEDGGPLGAAPTANAATTWALYSAMAPSLVDGRFCLAPGTAGMLVGSATYADADAVYRNNNSDESIAERWARANRLRVSAAIPAAAANVQSILGVKGTTPAAVQPLWPGIRIEDVYTRSAHGEVKFTAVARAAFSILQPSAYDWFAANVS